MHLVSHIPESIWQMGSCDNFTSDICERLHIANVQEEHRSTNKVNYIRQMFKHNDQCTGLDYMEETLSYLALQGWYDIVSAKDFNGLSATDKRRSTHRAHHVPLPPIEDKPILWPVSQQLYHERETHVRGVCRRIKLTSLRDASDDLGIPTFGLLFCMQMEEHWEHKVSGLVLGYDQNVLLAGIFIKL
jgi:hypothetical protein